jgi:hypothetical protein
MSPGSTLQVQFKGELDAILDEYKKASPSSDYDDLSDLGYQFAHRMTTRAKAAIHRIAGPSSAYAIQMDTVLARKDEHDYSKLMMAMGVAEALRDDIQAGYLQSIPQLIHGELFGDFLEMADHLLREGYKDAAAVLVGGTLEGHLRQLCQAHGVAVVVPSASGPRPKKAEQMNADLAQAELITKLDSKNITAWLDLRNNAAHGKYDHYTREQVQIALAAVRDFLARVPA